MGSFLTQCFRCGALIRFMVSPDPEIPQFCGQPSCIQDRAVLAATENADFEEAKKAMAKKPSVGQRSRAEMRAARGK